MKLQDSAFSSVKATNLPPAIVSYLHNAKVEYEEIPVKGGLLEDIKYAWLASENKLAVINLKTNQKIASWNFGVDLKEYKSRITSVCELPTHLTPNSKQLLVGLECDIIGGMVCLFHCDGSRVLRAIQTDCKVTSLMAFDDLPAGPLSCFDGVVLVGTQDGALFAFDLNRQSCFEAISHAMYGNEHLIRNETNIARLAVLSLDNISVIEEQRAIACNRDDHIAVQLNEGCFHGKLFILYNPDSTIGFRASRDEVFVSYLLYVPQLASLIVGFSCGAFQIWNLLTTELEFTSQVSEEQLPITHIAFQEPSDDPCAFCYLWIVYSVLDKLYDEGYPLAALYSLRYQSKKVISNTLCLYQDFNNCTLRFQLELTYPKSLTTLTSGLIGGRSIACHSISKTVNKSDDADDTIINVCQISWECWQMNQQVPLASYMILFDLDQWYKEHMPYSANVETNNYLSFVNLTQCITNNTQSHFCDVKVDVSSLSQYISVQKLDEHFYPNSYAYDCTCIVSTESVWLSTLGVQRQLLSTLNSLGPSILLNPERIYKQCIDVGLTPIYFDIPVGLAPLSVQRTLVLSVALAGRLWRLLLRCARESPITPSSPEQESDSSSSKLPPLAEWAWARTSTLRTAAHNLSRPLWVPTKNGAVNTIKSGPDRNSLRLLRECTAQLASLDSLFGAVVENTLNRVEQDVIYDISQRKNAVHMVSLYFRVMQWFVDAGLLPEYHLDEESILDLLDDNVQRLPYPVDTLIRSYQSRRCQLFRLQGDSADDMEMQPRSCPLLFIDQFINKECSGDKLKCIWKEDGSMTDGLYPPPSLHSLLKVYLQPDILEDNKHSLILYALEDYAMIFGDRYSDAIRRLMQFPTLMDMSNTNIKITQAFWHLDHKCFDFALEQLWGVCNGCSSGERWSWVQGVVVASLTAQKRAQAALQWLAGTGNWNTQSKDSDSDMVVDSDSFVEIGEDSKDNSISVGSLYLARRLPEAAMEILRHSNPKTYDYFAFFDECKRMGLLSKISKILLTKREEDLFVEYLKRSKDAQVKGILVLFYLQRARYAEALNVKYGDKEPNAEIWSLLVQMYSSGIPTLKTLTTVTPSQQADSTTVPVRVSEPTPMSVFVGVKTPKPITYKSTLIQTAITKASETWADKPAVLRGLKRTLEAEDTPFICTPKIGRTRGITPDEDVDWDGSTPSKRPKVSEDTLTVKLASKLEYDNPTLESDLNQMLHSPAVERGPPSTPSRSFSPSYLSTREATPQSILKVRKLLERRSPSDPRYYAETDEELETASQHTQHSESISRSIRFNIPHSDGSRESTPPSLSDSTFIEELKTPSLSIQSQIETATNYDLPRKKLLLTTEREAMMDNASMHSLSDQSSVNSENDGAFYSPNESISDVLPEIYPLPNEVTNANISPHDDYVTMSEVSEDVILAETESEGSVDSSEKPQSDASSPLALEPIVISSSIAESSDELFDDTVDKNELNETNVSVFVPKPRRSIRSKTPDSTEIPLRRSTRSRSKTPEPHPITIPLSPRSKSSVVKTAKPRKSLSRQVLEANTFIRKESAIADTETLNRKDRIKSKITKSGCESQLNTFEYSDSITSAAGTSQNDFISSPVTRIHLPEYNDSFLSSIASDSSQDISDNESLVKSQFETPRMHNVKTVSLSCSTFETPTKRLNLLDCSESILCSDLSDISQNVSDYEAVPVNKPEKVTVKHLNRSEIVNTPITLSESEFEESILSSETSVDSKKVDCSESQPNTSVSSDVVNDSILTDKSIFKASEDIQSLSSTSESQTTNKLIVQDQSHQPNKESNKNDVENVSKDCEIAVEVDAGLNRDKVNVFAKEISIIGEEIVSILEVNVQPDFQIPIQMEEKDIFKVTSNKRQAKLKVASRVNESEKEEWLEEEEELEDEEIEGEEVGSEEEEEEEEDELGVDERGEQAMDSDSSNDSSELELNIDTDREVSLDESSNNEINKAERVTNKGSEVICLDSSSESELEEISSENKAVSNDCIESNKSESNDGVAVKNTSEKCDFEPKTAVSLSSSVSSDVSMLKRDSSDPFLESMQDSDVASLSQADSTLIELPKFSTIPSDFSNYSILTDDESFIDAKLQFDVNPVTVNSETITVDSKTVESPVKVIVTDSEGKSTVEIEKGSHFVDENNQQKNKQIEQIKDVNKSGDQQSEKDTVLNTKESLIMSVNVEDNIQNKNADMISNAAYKDKPEKIAVEKAVEIKDSKETRSRRGSTSSNTSDNKTKKKTDKTKTSSEKDVAAKEESPDMIPDSAPSKLPESEKISDVKDHTALSEISKSPGRKKLPSTGSERLTRSKAKSDDSISVASDTSEASLSKPRRSTLLPKVDLSVIPEDSVSILNITSTSNVSRISEYSTSRRLTRHQHSLIEKSTKPPARRITTRRSSATNASIAGSDMSESFDDDRSEASLVHVESIDPISLLDRNEDGTIGNSAFDISMERGRRAPQAFSDIGSPIRAPARSARITRRSSVDVASLARNIDSPVDILHSTIISDFPSTPESSGRQRRQSFTKAIEALQQPRRTRRSSTDSKLDDSDLANTSDLAKPSKQKLSHQDLQGTSTLEPVLEDEVLMTTPRRRTRRAASEILSSSLHKAEIKDTPRRTRAGSAPRK